MYFDRYKICSVLALILISTIPLFSAHKVDRIIQLSYGATKGTSIRKTFSGNYGISSFTIVSEKEIALLNSVEQKVVIYSSGTKQLNGEIRIDGIPRDFIYCEDRFYVLFEKHISGYDRDGTKVIDIELNSNLSFVDRIYNLENTIYLLMADGRSFKVYENGSSISSDRQIQYPTKGMLLQPEESYQVIKEDNFRFGIFIYRKDILNEKIPVKTDKKIGCISIIGLSGSTLYLDVQYIKHDVPIEVERHIIAYSLQSNEILDDFELPSHYFLYTKRDLLVHGGSFYNLLTTEKDISVFKVDFDGSVEKTGYPEEFSKTYHYNDHLPKIEDDFQPRKSGFAYDSIKRSEIMDNARPYMDVQWYCSPENSSNNEIIRLPDSAYIRTPAWVGEGNLVAVPYKWGGFTHIDNFSPRILAGAFAGDNYTSRTDPWAVSFGDTYCVGLDCSGYVSRVWGLSGKEWTGSLPYISYELQYWDQVLKGDIYNKSGSHVMLVVENNPSGTVNIAHASGYDWKVSKWTYTPANLSGFVPRQYMYVINDLFPVVPETDLLQNYPNPFSSTTTISFYMRDPSIVSLKVYNLNGELVGILIDGFVEAGENIFEWNVGKLPAGVYIYRFEAPGFTKTKRCVIIK